MTKIISIEGLDKSGKHTISEYIKETLEKENKKVAKMEFPAYDTEIGQLIRGWLDEKYDFTNETLELLMAADKSNGQKLINKYIEENYDYIIIDRYIHSQLAYGQYKNNITWLKAITDNLIKPDYTFFLDVEPETSIKRKGQHGDNDRYEKDFQLLKNLKKYYKKAFIISKTKVFNVNANNNVNRVIADVSKILKEL